MGILYLVLVLRKSIFFIAFKAEELDPTGVFKDLAAIRADKDVSAFLHS